MGYQLLLLVTEILFFLAIFGNKFSISKGSTYTIFEWWYNTNFHSPTNATPYEILYCLKPPLYVPYIPKDSMVAAVDAYLTTREEMFKKFRANLQHA
jgi:hypothetical protein